MDCGTQDTLGFPRPSLSPGQYQWQPSCFEKAQSTLMEGMDGREVSGEAMWAFLTPWVPQGGGPEHQHSQLMEPGHACCVPACAPTAFLTTKLRLSQKSCLHVIAFESGSKIDKQTISLLTHKREYVHTSLFCSYLFSCCDFCLIYKLSFLFVLPLSDLNIKSSIKDP